MSIVRPIVRSIVKSITNGIDGVTRRYFTDISAAAMQYYPLSSTVTLSGDFSVRMKVGSTNVGTNQILIGPAAGTDEFIKFRTDNKLSFKVNGVELIGVDTSVRDGWLHDLEFSRVGTTISIFIDGVLDNSTTTTVVDFDADQVGRNAGGNYFDGIIADLFISDAGTPVVDIPFNTDLSSSTIPNLAAGNPGAPASATAINGPTAELFALNVSTDPNQWENADKTTIIPVA